MKDYNKNFLIGLLGLTFFVLILIGSPLALIWAWNTLFFKLHFIEFSFENWVAVSIFMWAFGLLKLDFTNLNNKNGH